ncbi:MAG: Lrp/AsnC family transcriptional regulator [Aestuariivita sp.]|uniref:Lrp/AsnC family transcriptional regulator n=1 Tax=Aestuariivita sp. TaxID=1872407 RepID=UPI003BAF1DA3
METVDTFDRRILTVLQRAADTPLEAIGEEVGLSRNAVWRRIRAMDGAGIIRARRAEVDAARLGLGLMVFIQIRTHSHDPGWQSAFSKATKEIPGILSVYRMTGDLDYLIRARVADMADYDLLYQQLIRRVPLSDVAASFVMEEIKDDPVLPL